MNILGIWDGHDAGAAIVEGDEIKAAVNEERLTRKKLDVGFPEKSIRSCLDVADLKPSEISHVAISTSDWLKAFTRTFPSMKRNYYNFRRRLSERPRFVELRRKFKYLFEHGKPNLISRKVTKRKTRKRLEKMGFEDPEVHITGHHKAHAAAAAYTSPFKKALVVTMDAVGDGLSTTVNIYRNGELEKIAEVGSKDSIGTFYEQATVLMGKRELEDEGKVMALADFAYPTKNELSDFFEVDGLEIEARYSPLKQYEKLKDVLWHNPQEEFAWMVQKTLEEKLKEYYRNVVKETGIRDVCWSGGIAANIKGNMQVRLLPEVDGWFVFPHMGDGGLALGSAMVVNNELRGTSDYEFDQVYFGPEYSSERIESTLEKESGKIEYEREDNIEERVADLITNDEVVLWYRGKMEYGPRALGNRSILAPAYSEDAKERINMKIKERQWYQPFCPSLLESEREKFLRKSDQPAKFMTMGFMTPPELRDRVRAVINVDGSCRPQSVGKENPGYKKILEEIKNQTGDGIVLNTSFNIHGEPIVNTPEDALSTMLRSDADQMAIGNYLVKKR